MRVWQDPRRIWQTDDLGLGHATPAARCAQSWDGGWRKGLSAVRRESGFEMWKRGCSGERRSKGFLLLFFKKEGLPFLLRMEMIINPFRDLGRNALHGLQILEARLLDAAGGAEMM